MVARWARWRALPARERRETWLAAGLIPIAAASLRVVGAPRTLRSLARRPRGAKTGDVQATARAAARAVARAARHAPYRGNCLSQSIALMWLLGRRGIAADLRFGARRREGRLEAHAWVEHEGVALNDSAGRANTFSVFGREREGTDRAAGQEVTRGRRRTRR